MILVPTQEQAWRPAARHIIVGREHRRCFTFAANETSRAEMQCVTVGQRTMKGVAAADAAAAVVSCRREVSQMLANAALGGGGVAPSSDSLASAVHMVQAACDILDTSMAVDEAETAPVLDAVHRAWSVYNTAAISSGPHPAPDNEDLLTVATACLPSSLLERPHAPLCLSERSFTPGSGSTPRRCLELKVDGAFKAVIEFTAAGRNGGDADGSAGGWVPCRVAVGASHEPMPFGASTPPSLHVHADLTARAGALLAGLDALPPARRLPCLLRWLTSLHSLFQTACHGCGRVFPPDATGATQLLPPTARGPRLEPYHPGCFCVRFGRSAEEAFLDAALRCS